MNNRSFIPGLVVSTPLLMACILSIESCGKGDTLPPPKTPPTTSGAPLISSFAPASAAKDATVIITGANFSASISANTVTINGVAATVLAATSTSLTVKVPLHAGNGKITLKTGGQTVNAANDFTYLYTVTTLAGDGTPGFINGVGTSAEFNSPFGVVADASGNVYVADEANNRIRKITSAGVVSTLAGDGTPGFKDGAVANARFNYPEGVAVNASGNVFTADFNNNRIRKITTATVSTVAGNNTAAFKNGTGTAAQFNSPYGVAVEASGNIYVADAGNNRIRKITPAGVVSTLAGDGTTAQFDTPTGVAVDDSGNVYVADLANNRIRKITSAGVVSTLAGDGNSAFNDGPAASAQFNYPVGIAVDASGNIYVADQGNNRIRKITPAGEVSTIAGDGNPAFNDGPANTAQFNSPTGVATDASGNIYVADYGNNRIRKLQ